MEKNCSVNKNLITGSYANYTIIYEEKDELFENWHFMTSGNILFKKYEYERKNRKILYFELQPESYNYGQVLKAFKEGQDIDQIKDRFKRLDGLNLKDLLLVNTLPRAKKEKLLKQDKITLGQAIAQIKGGAL